MFLGIPLVSGCTYIRKADGAGWGRHDTHLFVRFPSDVIEMLLCSSFHNAFVTIVGIFVPPNGGKNPEANDRSPQGSIR